MGESLGTWVGLLSSLKREPGVRGMCGRGTRGQNVKGASQGVQGLPDPGDGEATGSPGASGRSSGRSNGEDRPSARLTGFSIR